MALKGQFLANILVDICRTVFKQDFCLAVCFKVGANQEPRLATFAKLGEPPTMSLRTLIGWFWPLSSFKLLSESPMKQSSIKDQTLRWLNESLNQIVDVRTNKKIGLMQTEALASLRRQKPHLWERKPPTGRSAYFCKVLRWEKAIGIVVSPQMGIFRSRDFSTGEFWVSTLHIQPRYLSIKWPWQDFLDVSHFQPKNSSSNSSKRKLFSLSLFVQQLTHWKRPGRIPCGTTSCILWMGQLVIE